MIINNINSEVINEVKSKTKMSDFKRGNDIVMSKKAILTKFDIVDDFTFSFAANVMDGSENYRVEVEVDNGNFIERKCNCDDFARNEQKNCAHIAAGVIAFDKDKEVAKKALEEDEDFEEAKEPEEHKPIGIKKVTNDMKYKEAFHLLKIFSPEETAKRADKRHIGKIKITPKLEYNKAENVFASTF
ncbi:MAG: hypothetical protein MJ246_06195 [Clostridia bacterium]|nr:hypothetical protein [Clostridia bacterium]